MFESEITWSSPFWLAKQAPLWLQPWRRQDAEVKDLEHEIRQRRHSAVLKEEKFRGRKKKVARVTGW